MTTVPADPLRVLFVALKHDYGFPGRGFSYEYLNFYETLRGMPGVRAELFPFDEEMRVHGRRKMNDRLEHAILERSPHLCFFFLFTDEIVPKTIARITNETVTLNWFADDHWRYEGFTRFWAPLFRFVVTTDEEAVEKYYRDGVTHVLHSQWGFNDALCRPADLPEEFDVTFVGQVHSDREARISVLRENGVDVRCWGKGWPSGRISQEDMIPLFRRSRINLNFTESSAVPGFRTFTKAVINRRADDTYHLRPPREMLGHLRTSLRSVRPQIKGRNFEIPGSGGFLLTEHAPGIERYFVPDREIATFSSDQELLEKIRYYLAHAEEREAVRIAGYRRAAADHTYRRRFEQLFNAIFPGRAA